MPDVLTEVLGLLRIQTTVYSLARLTGEWGVSFPRGELAYFHVLSGAGAWIALDGEEAQPLASGEAVLLAHGTAHSITSGLAAPIRAAFDPDTWSANRLSVAEPAPGFDASPQAAAGLVCGAVRLENVGSNLLIGALPELVRVPAASPRRRELDETLGLIDRVAAQGGQGSEVLLARLGDVLLVQLVRTWLAEQRPGAGGWLGALREPHLGDAIAAIHGAPEADWTVARLAAIARLSRSRFAERFTTLVGEPPLTYLKGWRMTVAANMLLSGQRTVADVANAVGYRSGPAFSRAFARFHGSPPREFASVRQREPIT